MGWQLILSHLRILREWALVAQKSHTEEFKNSRWQRAWAASRKSTPLKQGWFAGLGQFV
jgi:hypothetical protein